MSSCMVAIQRDGSSFALLAECQQTAVPRAIYPARIGKPSRRHSEGAYTDEEAVGQGKVNGVAAGCGGVKLKS